MTIATIYPRGEKILTVPANESIAISNYGGGRASIYYLIETANYPSVYTLHQTLVDSAVTLGAFTADQIIKIEAGNSKVLYEVGTAPTVSSGDANTLGGELPSYYSNADNIDSGTLGDDRLSSNITKKNAANVFTADQTVQEGSPNIQLNETDTLTSARFALTGGKIYIFAGDTGDYEQGSGDLIFCGWGGSVDIGSLEVRSGGANQTIWHAGNLGAGPNGTLRLPSLTSDPVSGEAAGQIYYNTTSNVVRFYNGSAWGDI